MTEVNTPVTGPDSLYTREAVQQPLGYYRGKPVFPIRGAESNGAPPAAAPPASQGDTPPAPGAEAPKGGEGGFNWGLFPDVPEDQRASLEPHLKNVQGHVTQLEQAHAPFKDLAGQGITPEQLQPLIAFDQAIAQDPVGTWLTMAENMQQQGLMIDLELETLRSIATGSGGEGPEVPEGLDPGNPLTQTVQELRTEIEELKGWKGETETQTRTNRETQLLNTALTGMRTQLTEAGVEIPEQGSEGHEEFERLLASSLITANGDVASAVKAITSFRENTLKGFTKNRTTNKGDDPSMPKGNPPTPERKNGGSRDGFRAARAGAAQFLKGQNAANAQP